VGKIWIFWLKEKGSFAIFLKSMFPNIEDIFGAKKQLSKKSAY